MYLRLASSWASSSVAVYKLDYILQYYNISYNGLLCAMLLQGNDFVNGVPYHSIPSRNQIKSIDGLIQYVKNEIRHKHCDDVYCSINKSISRFAVFFISYCIICSITNL